MNIYVVSFIFEDRIVLQDVFTNKEKAYILVRSLQEGQPDGYTDMRLYNLKTGNIEQLIYA